MRTVDNSIQLACTSLTSRGVILALSFLTSASSFAQEKLPALDVADSLSDAPVVLLEDWRGLPAPFNKKVDGAVNIGDELVMFYNGNNCILYDLMDPLHPYAPFAMKDSIAGWSAAWDKGISDAVEFNDTTVLIFNGDEYVWQDIATYEVSDPMIFTGLPGEWDGAFDAVVRWSANQILFIKGNMYVEWDLLDDSMSVPQSFTAWPGWPADWTSVDAATNPGYDVVYFFRHGDYLAYDQSAGGFISGFPKPIGGQ